MSAIFSSKPDKMLEEHSKTYTNCSHNELLEMVLQGQKQFHSRSLISYINIQNLVVLECTRSQIKQEVRKKMAKTL